MLHGLLASVTAFEDWFALLNRLLDIASVTAFEDWFAVLNGLLDIAVLFVSADASLAPVALFPSRINA